MSTRSRIAVRYNNETIGDCLMSIYCHWDGYPSHNGLYLSQGFKTLDEVLDLMSLGDLSSLGTSINAHDGTRAYHRDSGEELTPAMLHNNVEELEDVSEGCWADYIYLYSGYQGKWVYKPMDRDAEWMDLEAYVSQLTKETI